MSKKSIGITFKPREPYTNRLKRILEDYPDGSQIIREILQNSDDAKSAGQTFILDHNTYPSTQLFEPLLSNCKTKLKLERYQGPALLSKNDTMFDERDFSSLLKLADSEKRDQFDKIGVMGVGFNSIYHITDAPSFITNRSYVILDPHEYYFEGGRAFDFVEDDLQSSYENQFLPFSKPFGNIKFDKPFEGTIFRYPLRTEQDSADSNISNISYSPSKILEMFESFYQKESVNCLLFLKYIETISFYELKKDAVKPDLLYKIELKNADKVRGRRCLIVEQIVKQMEYFQDQRADTDISKPAYIAEFSKWADKKDSKPEIQKWLILNYLDNLNKAEKYFIEKFHRSIGEYKFVPNVGLAVCLDDLQAIGRLFCFLPLPIDMPFRVSVHGYFAVSTNRRTLPADNEDLAVGSLALLKVGWNQYLFNKVLPSAWVELLHQLCTSHVIYSNPKEFYSLWPLSSSKKSSVDKLCKDILLNVVKNIKVEDRVFFSPSKRIDFNSTSSSPSPSYDRNFCWSSISEGYFEDESSTRDYRMFKILADLGFLVIDVPTEILTVLKESENGSSIKFYSPRIVKEFFHEKKYLLNDIPRDKIFIIFNYILGDDSSDYLDGLKMIPLSDGSLGTISTASPNEEMDEDFYYIGPDNTQVMHEYDERSIFKNRLSKFIDKKIPPDLWNKLYKNAKTNSGISNIKILNESVVAKMIESNLLNYNEKFDEIKMRKNDDNQREWIYRLWDNLLNRKMFEFKHFENLHILPTNDDTIDITLRRLKTTQKCFYCSDKKTNPLPEEIITIFKSFGLVFVEKEFNESFASEERLKNYVIKITDVVTALKSLKSNRNYPSNLSSSQLNKQNSPLFTNYLAKYLKKHTGLDQLLLEPKNFIIEVLRYFPIYSEVVETDNLINLVATNRKWFLLPTEVEHSYGKILVPKNKDGFLHVGNDGYRYLLEDVIKISRLGHVKYWSDFVLPYLEKRNFNEIKVVIERLFEVSPALMKHDIFKEKLAETKFVPSGTLLMAQGKAEAGDRIVLSKPKELYDPALLEFFFEDENLFPINNFAVSSNVFLYQLGLKRSLSSNDISDRIKSYLDHRKNPDNVMLETIHKKSLIFLKHIDSIWEKKKIHEHKSGSERLQLHTNIAELEWIPTIDYSGAKKFSRAKECRPNNDKKLVGLVMPIVEYALENRLLKEIFGWNNYVPVKNVIQQMQYCSSLKPENKFYRHRSGICKSIYKYIDSARKGSDEQSREELQKLKNEFNINGRRWIFWEDQFYSPNQVVLNLPKNLQSRDSLIIQLPIEYKREFEEMFKEMGIRENVEIPDFVNAIKDINNKVNNGQLSQKLLGNVMELLEQISTLLSSDGYKSKNNTNLLDGLLVPNTESKLVDIKVIQFDNMPDVDKGNDELAHPRISLDMANNLKLKMFNGSFIESINVPFKFDPFEQKEKLTVRLKNIIESYYSINSLFKEFLQNADDAKATEFCIFVDYRDFKLKKNQDKSKLLSPEMNDWQGPAIWIYNDAKFTEEDFRSFIELGVSGKNNDHGKIGRFGLGFNCAYHITDCPSFVSGEHIAFLDPHSKFLPAQGRPPTRWRGNILKFLEKSFDIYFEDQVRPYKRIKNCDFTKKFEGTLFRLPFRTHELADISEISNKVEDPDSIVELLSKIEGSREILFLKNIKSFSVHKITKDDDQISLIWKANIHLLNDLGSIRNTFNSINNARPFELCIETESNTYNCKETVISSEKWLVCNGEEQKTLDMDLQNLSTSKGLKPRGGVAIFWAQAYKPLDEIHENIDLEPPQLKGDNYVYLPLSIETGLNVHLNGEFLLSNDRKSVLQLNNNKSTESDSTEGKWNKYILHELLPILHVKLLEDIAKRVYRRFTELKDDASKKSFNGYTTTHFWPVINSDTIYKKYGTKVLRKLVEKNSEIFWSVVDGGKFVCAKDAYFLDSKEDIDIHLFAENRISIVKLEEKQLKNFQVKYSPIEYRYFDTDMFCNLLKYVDESLLNHQKIFKILYFILVTKEEPYKKLLYLPLVPLCNNRVGCFGKGSYFIDSTGEYSDLFPKAYSDSKFVSNNLPNALRKIFCEDEFSSALGVRKAGAGAILDLIGYQLPHNDMNWDPESESIPNRGWLLSIWEKLAFTDYDYSKLRSYPLLAMIHPRQQLVLPNSRYPLLLIDKEELVYKVLVKLNVRFTNMPFPGSANPHFQQFIVEWSFTNALKAIEYAAIISDLGVSELFTQADLTDKDIEMIRSFVMDHFNIYGKTAKREKIKPILSKLQIWPVHSSSRHNYVAVVDGLLLPKTLRQVPFQVDANYFLAESDREYDILVELGAKIVDPYKFLTQDLLPHIPNTPDQDYVQFLINVLLLNDQNIISYFRNQQSSIPNKILSGYYKANELYNENVSLFKSIFRESNRFLPDELQNHPQCLVTLREMGFRNSVNGESFIECAEEILRHTQDETPFNVVKDKAKYLLEYFYRYYNTELVGFTSIDQLNRFLNIKIVPVAKNLEFPYRETVKNNIYFESLNSICFQKHRDLCWTQVCLIDMSMEPPNTLFINKLGFPTFQQIFDHLCYLSSKSREYDRDWISQNADKYILNSTKEIYSYLNKCLETKEHVSENTIQEAFRTDEPVFLNGDDPFTLNSWKSGKQLVIDIQMDINDNLCKVKPNLEQFKRLLKVSGANELKGMDMHKLKAVDYSQKEKLLKGLFDSLTHSVTRHHDVIFNVENEKIAANRYVLSAASVYYKNMFCGESQESQEFQKVYVELTDIKPEGFKIFLGWLYGQSLDELINKFASKKTKGDDYASYYLKLLLGILKYSDMCVIEELKVCLEYKIITSNYIGLNNVDDVMEWAKMCRADQLIKRCKEYINANEKLLENQRRSDIGEADENTRQDRGEVLFES